jgi:hypothetical protein
MGRVVRKRFGSLAVLLTVWLCRLVACQGDTNSPTGFQAALPSFFMRSHLHSGILEYSRYFSAAATGEDKENARVLLVFDGDRYFEKTLFSPRPGQPQIPHYEVFNGMITIVGDGPPVTTWVIHRQPKMQPGPSAGTVLVRYDPLQMLDIVLFGNGEVPFAKAETVSVQSEAGAIRHTFVSADKKTKGIWWWRNQNGTNVPWKFRAVSNDDQLLSELEYMDWKQYAGTFWFPATTMVRGPASEAKGKAFGEKYVVQKLEPNVPIHSKWFLPQFPENVRIHDETLSPSLIDRPLDLRK